MQGIDLNQPILYKHSSLRFFNAGEYHISRLCEDDVLLLVYDGVLRFTEDSIPYELHPGSYHIQRHGSVQTGHLPSDAPKYLYVHFLAEWSDGAASLPSSGVFDYVKQKPLIEELDALAHNGAPYILQAGLFFSLLTQLFCVKPADSAPKQIADLIARECHNPIQLEQLCDQFHFSKNHIINIFKKEFGVTPITYANRLRIRKAEYLIEVTSDSLEHIASACGFQNYSHFYKLFCREHGCPPEKWRLRKRLG